MQQRVRHYALRLSCAAAIGGGALGCASYLKPMPAPQSNSAGNPAASSGDTGRVVPEASPSASSAIRPYNHVIPADAKTRVGMFATHRVGDKLYFEIPRHELNKDMLLVGRYVRAALADEENPGLGASYGGDEFSERTVRWERVGNRVLMRSPSFAIMADTALPVYQAVQAGNYATIDAIFDVMTYGPDSAAVIDVTRLFVTTAPGFSAVGNNVDPARSFIESAIAFPDNVEIEGVQTAGTPGSSESVLAHWSLVRLPTHPMTPRLADDRVGFFDLQRRQFGANEGYSVEKRYIARWRLVKKDTAATLSEPVTPLIYYIDPATPDVWKPWIRKAVLEWQPAFEAAGFKNAILPMDPPANDPDWSPEDVRHTVIRWLPSPTENAVGPHISDPRTGEVLNGSIRIFNDILKLQRDWYFSQVAPLDPRAQKWPLPDSLMGRILQYVVAHEIGHTLGLTHNFVASSTYPADSVRSATWVHTMGFVPSIMDYARFDYVAQPEDHIAVNDLIPRVGPYDRFAIMWGYKPVAGAHTPEQERPALDTWARMQDSVPWYRFSRAAEIEPKSDPDPGDEMEAIGDADAVKSTGYGLKNLKRIVPMLLPATQQPAQDNRDLEDGYTAIVKQWTVEMRHVARIVGGADTRIKYGGQSGPLYTPVTRARQIAAIQFLNSQAFTTPVFLLDQNVLRRLEANGAIARIDEAQTKIFRALLDDDRTARLVEYQALAPSAASVYTVTDLLDDLRRGIWHELNASRVSIDPFRRALQRSYLNTLDEKLNPRSPLSLASQPDGQLQLSKDSVPTPLSDVHAAIRESLATLQTDIHTALPRATDRSTRNHLQDVERQIDRILRVREQQTP